MDNKKQIISILFADIENYSQIRDDDLYVKLKKFEEEFKFQYLKKENHIFFKSWGDAFFICSYDPVDLAEIALNMRDKFKNTNWERIGFSTNITCRIGLHAEKARILEERGEIKDIVGHSINSTARIEPIVEPNCVYCSEIFYYHLSHEKSINVKCLPLGSKKLAKNFGEMNLFRLLWDHEVIDTKEIITDEAFTIPETKIRKKVKEKDIDDFLRKSFEFISLYFKEALRQLQEKDKDVEIDFHQLSEQKFTCQIYVCGEAKAKCTIWYGSDLFPQNILYSHSISMIDNSYNESLTVKHDGFSIFLEPMMGKHFRSTGESKFMTHEEAARYLWSFLTENLEY